MLGSLGIPEAHEILDALGVLGLWGMTMAPTTNGPARLLSFSSTCEGVSGASSVSTRNTSFTGFRHRREITRRATS